MQNRILILLYFLFITPYSLLHSQNNFTTNKKAFRYYDDGERYLNQREYTEAEESLKKAISHDKNFAEAYNMLGDVYAYEEKYELAIESYKKGIEMSQGKYPVVYIALANAEFSIANYTEAKDYYEQYLKIREERRAKSEEETIVKKQIKNCEFAIEAMKHPVPFNIKNLGQGVNTKLNEYLPCLTVDGKTLLFTRRLESRDSNLQTSNSEPITVNEDFFVSYLSDNTWSKAENIGPPINTKYNEGAPCLSPDGQILIFTACEAFGNYGQGRNGYGSCDLFFSRKVGDKWSNPINMGPPINSANWESQPSYSSDGRTLYFIRGTYDKSRKKHQYIYMSEVGDDGKWKEPVKLNSKINVPGSTPEGVFIHPDNQTLYFSSDGPPGMGGKDIFLSRRLPNGDWGEPVNLGYPINTNKDERYFTVSGDGKLGYFASDRPGGYGELDLYSFELPLQDRPLPVSYMKGRIFNKETKKPVFAKFELIDLQTSRTGVKSYSNKGNGEFLVCLPTNKNYALNVSAEGYLFYSENFTFKDTVKSDEPRAMSREYPAFNKDIALQPIKVGERVVLRNIFFETAKYDLKPESQAELNKLLDLLDKNPKMKIELSGHTDNVGGKDYNQTLSESRAKAVYDYLTSHNISPDRLSYKGFGDTKPIDTNDTEQGRANNRRTEFNVTGD